MSQNPFESTPSLPNAGPRPAPNAAESVTQQKPTGLTVVPVLCLVLGVLGVLTGLLGMLMVFFQKEASSFQNLQANQAPGIVELQAKILEFQQTQTIPNLIFHGCNLIVGALLIIGALGVLGLQESKRGLLRNTLLCATIFVVLRGFYYAWVQYSSMNLISGMTLPNGSDTATFTFQTAMQVGFIIGIAFAVAWAAILVVFYLWSRSYLGKESVVPLFKA